MVRLILALSLLISTSCSSPAARPLQSHSPESPPIAPSNILARSDEAMAQLSSFRVTSDVRPTVGGRAPTTNRFEFTGPRCIRNDRSVADSSTSGPDCPCGFTALQAPHPSYFQRAKGGALGAPPFAGATPAEHVQAVRVDVIDGVEAWVVTYDFKVASIEGPFTVWRTEWIAVHSFVLLHQEQRDDDQFGVQAVVTNRITSINRRSPLECR